MGKRQGTLEGVVIDNDFWQGKRVLVTGHTGFKGSWLSLWLTRLGARVFGYSLVPEGEPNLFSQLDLDRDVDHHVGDVRDSLAVRSRVASVRPDVVLHLAAQALVRRSYAEPLVTWQTNVIGTANLLDALRSVGHRCAAVIVTTDKVYENREWVHSYRETDRLGGHDPYSSSKAVCELAVDSWRKSFFHHGSDVRVATARAGNVIGGGDWSEDRILPDLARAFSAGLPLTVRNPQSIRPWQHVLDPLCGYMALARRLWEHDDPNDESAFNFGPDATDSRTVAELVTTAAEVWPGATTTAVSVPAPHEACLLTLTSEKARNVLGWQPRWGFDAAVRSTIAWYRATHEGANPREMTIADIERFERG